jgi:predicted aspartyl protease
MPAYDADLFDPPAPLAKVILRNSDSGDSLPDVPMLIDTGADVTLIPQSSIKSLGMSIEFNDSIRTDGLRRQHERAQVVHLDLVFLRRVFRGRFLLNNQEYGFLGRDILNHVMMVLDGPNLSWEEERLPRR